MNQNCFLLGDKNVLYLLDSSNLLKSRSHSYNLQLNSLDLCVPKCKICNTNSRTIGRSIDGEWFPCCNKKICKIYMSSFCFCKKCYKKTVHNITNGISRIQCSKCNTNRYLPNQESIHPRQILSKSYSNLPLILK